MVLWLVTLNEIMWGLTVSICTSHGETLWWSAYTLDLYSEGFHFETWPCTQTEIYRSQKFKKQNVMFVIE